MAGELVVRVAEVLAVVAGGLGAGVRDVARDRPGPVLGDHVVEVHDAGGEGRGHHCVDHPAGQAIQAGEVVVELRSC